MKQNKAILLLMILQAINSNCSDGCLKCDIANRCQVCDITSFYIQKNGVCVEKAPENCAMITTNGDCYRCKSSYFQDLKTGKCVKVPKDQSIQNCRFYRNSKECQVCQRGFYLEEGFCVPVEIHVPGCLINGRDTCIECEKGMILHPSRERCVESPESNKCLVYGYLDCLECKPGHVLNSNYRVKNLLDTSKNRQVGEFLRSVTEGRVDFRLKSNCEPVSVPDCEVFETFSKCKQCRPFYLLTKDKKCKSYPLPSIPNCFTYGNYNLCLSCMQGYKLNSPSECIAVKKIQNCSTYSTTTSANICTECEEGYYLFSNTCRERLNIVDQCEQDNLNKDECSKCKQGYVLTDDSLKCLSEVTNCNTYAASSSQSTQHTCTSCNETFYLKDNSCIIGGIANCQFYVDSDNCSQCQNGFYIKNDVTPNVCVQQTQIEKCDQYSTTVKDKCDVCSNDSVMVKQQIGCTAITNKVANCQVYSDKTTCSICMEGYYLTNNSCQVIPENENCLIKDNNNQCTKCKEGYYDNIGLCYKPIDYQQKQCLDWDQKNNLQSFDCQACNQFTLPWVLNTDSVLCATREEINSLRQFQTKIQNCLIHQDDGNTQKCMRCDKDYYISEDKLSCVLSCPNLVLIDQKKDIDRRANRCIDDNTLQNCSKAVTYKNKNVCIACKTGFLQSVSGDENKELIGINPHNLKVNVGIHYLGFSCIQKQNGQQYETTQSQNPSPNCETFTQGQNNKLYCTRCKFGYTGNYLSTNDQNLVNLRCDNKVKDCDLDTYYGGLLNNQNAVDSLVKDKFNLLNCHKCLTKGNIPFLFTDEQLQIKQFSLEYGNEEPTQQDMNNSQWLQCLKPRPESFKMTPERFQSVFPKNCGFGQFQITRDKDFRLFTENFNSLKCLFCKPGFRPIYQVVNGNDYTIVDCVQIENCLVPMMKQDQWFSACSQCEPYNAWVYEQETEVVRYDQCVQTKDFNCMIISNKDLKDKFNNHRSERCLLCRPGYGLNYDGVCEQMTHELCVDGEFQMDYSYFFDNNEIKNTEHLTQLFGDVQIGCSRCKEGYEGFLWDTDYHTCLDSPYLLKQQFCEETKYIPNCQKYYLDNNQLKCQQCLSNYIPLETNLKCIKKSSQPNCLVVNQDMKNCKTCDEGFVRVLGFCEKPQIKYCKLYATNEEKQTCLDCEETFVLRNNHCYPGTVEYCKNYNFFGDCSTCYDQYQLLKIKDSYYCVPFPETLNCTQLFPINNESRLSICLQCKEGFVHTQVQEELLQSICLPVISIENCENYDNQNLLSETTLQCTKCADQFFLRNNQCLERKIQTQNCKSYAPNNDYCSECLEGYYMTNLKECQSYPTGIYGCIEYETETVCKSCQKNMYLSSNSCVKVPKQKRLKNCDIYADIGSCAKCQFNFYLEDNVCVPARAQNCMEYEDINRCYSCPKGFGLQQNEKQRTLDCVHISTQNCLVSKNVYPFDCIKCTKLFYQDKGRCFANDKFIPHCDEYLSRDTCKKCEDGYVLSYDYERCLSSEEFGLTPSDSCANNMQSQRPFCYACEFGHKFYKNQCIQCRQQTLDAGCLYCEGLENEICLICKPGYFQDVSGKCNRNGTTPTPVTQDTQQTTTDEQDLVIEEMNVENEEKRQATTVILN